MPSKPHFKACVLAVALTMLPWCVEAAGLGRLNVLSGLGQPFKGEIELLAVQPNEVETLKIALAPAEAYASSQLSYPAPSLGLRFMLNKRESGRYVINVNSTQAIDEPVFNLLVDLSWLGGHVRREYTALIDPAGYAGASGAATAPFLSETTRIQTTSSDAVLPGTRVSGAIRAPKGSRALSKVKAAPITASGIASQPAAKGAESENRYTVKSGDTLSRIAGQVKPEGINLEQVMVGLYQANSDAFDGNMNRLKRGKILRVPSAEQLAQQDQTQAVKEIRIHSANWQTYRRQLAESAAKKGGVETGALPSGGRIAAKVEDKSALSADKTKDVLKLSRGASKADSQQGRVRALEEEAAARKKALDEANQRVTELQNNIQEMEKVAALKSQQGADLQKKAEQSKVAAPASSPVVAPIASAPAVVASKSAVAASAASVASAVQPKPKRVGPATPQEPGIMDTLLENALPIGGGLLAVVLCVGGLLWARNRRRPSVFEDSLITNGDLKPNTVLGRTGGGVISTNAENSFLTDFSRQGLGTIDTDEVDPIAEADVYMAYGRDVQAEEILKDALIKDPQRQEIRLKLLDIYAARKDKVSFQEVAAEVFAATSGQGQYWEQTSYLGRSLDPENPLYAVKNKDTDAALAVGAVGVAVAGMVSSVEAEPAELEASDETLLVAEEGLPPAVHEEGLETLDFEFELPEPEAASSEIQPEIAADELSEIRGAVERTEVAELTAVEHVEDATSLDFDLDMDFDLPAVPVESEPALVEQDDSLMELDLPIDLGSSSSVEPVLLTESTIDSSSERGAESSFASAPELDVPDFEIPDLDLNLELGEETSGDADVAEAAALASLEAEFSVLESSSLEQPQEETDFPHDEVIDLDFGFVPPEPEVAPILVSDEPIDVALEIGGNMENLDLVADDPVQTKIELARAYIDMGDVEGAREILQEAEQEGNPAQQELARNLLAAL